jgi:dolichyl-phosphate beta-glucosyltransferase|tara:strand:- start:171 stop:923 length:753 start_codon:yes stop_codon:yes gene_type:complete
MSKTAIIIPCYNESRRLDIKSYHQFLKENQDIDIYFLDDGSTDKTFFLIKDLNKEFTNCFSFSNKINLGKANITRLGIQKALNEKNYDYIGFFDADLATPLNEIFRFIRIFEKNKNLILVMGCRILRSGANIERNSYRHYFSRILVTIINLYLNIKFYDTQAGAKIFKASYVKNLFLDSFLSNWLFDIEIILRIKEQNPSLNIYKGIYELPLNSWVEKKGSKIKIIDILTIPFNLIKIKNRYKKKSFLKK